MTRAALAAKRARGERVGAVRYGYRLAEDGRTEVEDAGEQAVIAEARRLHDGAGLSLRAIGSELWRLGYGSRGGRAFQAIQVSRMVALPQASDGTPLVERLYPQHLDDHPDASDQR